MISLASRRFFSSAMRSIEDFPKGIVPFFPFVGAFPSDNRMPLVTNIAEKSDNAKMKVLVRYMSIIAILIAADMIIAATDTPQRNWMRLNRSVTEYAANDKTAKSSGTTYINRKSLPNTMITVTVEINAESMNVQEPINSIVGLFRRIPAPIAMQPTKRTIPAKSDGSLCAQIGR